MEERSKTIMCSVLFLDVVEYSKKSVSGQISLKERFNAFLSLAIRDVPLDDRIILDTGDGAALSFIGDIEDALQVALVMRESLRGAEAHMDPPLLVRMGINLGPVRLVKDINGQPNIVGDGINVAQRIMGFADPGQILVSRSYYDAVSRLSSEYAGMFHYEGSRTDKHVREHEIYAIGYPGEFTGKQAMAGQTTAKFKVLQRRLGSSWQGVVQRLGSSWQSAAQRLGKMVQAMIAAYHAATPRKRAAYIGGVAGFFVLAILVEVMIHHHAPAPEVQLADETPAGQAAAPSVADETQKAPVTGGQKTGESPKAAPAPSKQSSSVHSSQSSSSRVKPSTPAAKPESKSTTNSTTIFGITIPPPPKGKPGAVSVRCMEGSSIFVDGFSKGAVGKSSLRISLDPGKHHLTITHPGKPSVYTQVIFIKTGETLYVHPDFCN